MNESIPKFSNRQVVNATLIVVAICFIFFLIYRFSEIVFIFLLAVLLGIALRPIVNWLSRRGIPRQLGVLFVYVLMLGLLIGLIVLLLPLITGQIYEIFGKLPGYYGAFRSVLIQSSSRVLQQIGFQLPNQIMGFNPASNTDTGETLSGVTQSLPFVDIFTHDLLIVVAAFILGFYWILEGDRSIRYILFWVPPEKRESIRELISEIEEKLGGFILGQGLLCLIIGIMAVLAYLIIGLPYVLLLAVFAGILEAVPIFGPILGTLPAFLIALSIAPVKALQVVVAMIVIQGLENHFLVPRVMKRSVGVNSVVALLSLLAFTSFLGLAGAILAIPAAAIIQLVINRFMLAPVEIEVNSPDGRDQLSRLRYETQLFVLDVRNQLRENEQFDNSEQDVVDKMETIAAELDQLLSNSEQISEET